MTHTTTRNTRHTGLLFSLLFFFLVRLKHTSDSIQYRCGSARHHFHGKVTVAAFIQSYENASYTYNNSNKIYT